MATQSLTTGSVAGNHLRIDFVWNVDRYEQTILLVDAEKRETAILTSVEGNRELVWPPSPPLQDLNFHELPDGTHAALAVGMAGKSHWSLAWEASHDEPTLVCDAACRVKESPGYLAATWGICRNDLTIVEIRDETAQYGYRIELTPELFVRVSVDANDEFGAATELSDDNICLSARPVSAAPPTTIRWRYRIALGETGP